MSQADSTGTSPFEPKWPGAVAFGVFGLAALSLCWPMVAGRFLLGDDQYIAGYAFRNFGAEMFRATGSIPEWNPYLFGGLPFIAAQHGDIFYPTAWLRWVLPVDTAMNLGFAVHLVLAGFFTWLFLRALRVSWTAAMVGGLAYELTGIVASLVRPGHDGKLFVSALTPLAFFAVLRAVRNRRWSGYGLLALVVALCMLSPHYQMTYYLLVALGIWTLYLALLDPERPPDQRWFQPVGFAALAVLLGLAIAAVQILPFLAYLPFSPRAAGGPSGGWEYATSFSMPPEELMTAVLPQFNGVLDHYWGRNFFKLHTEYLGAIVVALAFLAWFDRPRRRTVLALALIGLLALLIAFGGHTPFYRVWYEVMPMMKKVRAPGMAFFLFAFPTALFAGFGADRLLRGEVRPVQLAIPLGVLGLLGLLGAPGMLQGVAQALAEPETVDRVAANAGELQGGAIRLLVFVVLGGVLFWAVGSRRLRGGLAAAAIALALVGDQWSVLRGFFEFKAGAAELYRDDAITSRIRKDPLPFRVLDAGVYQGSMLMTHDIMTVLGYHGNELRYYDELLGGKNVWRNVGSASLLDLLAVKYLILPQPQQVPGFHQVEGPVTTTPGVPGILYLRDTLPTYARVVAAAAKVPEDQIVPTVVDPRFPPDALVLYSDTASVNPGPLAGTVPPPPDITATIADWRPGAMRVTLAGSSSSPTYLVVAENWYPDWHATVDGQPATALRADNTLLSVVLPPGAKEVTFRFHSAEYATGRLISLVALAVTLGVIVVPLRKRNRGPHAA